MEYLQVLQKKYPEHPYITPQLVETVQNATHYSTYVELHYETDESEMNRRFDIQISNRDFILVFEVKIYAGLSDEYQLRDYRTMVKKLANNRQSLLIYLTRHSSPLLAAKHAEDKILIGSTWRDVQNALAKFGNEIPLSNTKFAIAQFFNQINNFY